MAKKIKPMVVKNPPPPEKKVSKKDDVDFIGNELANVSSRINELELSMDTLRLGLKRVMDRMGL